MYMNEEKKRWHVESSTGDQSPQFLGDSDLFSYYIYIYIVPRPSAARRTMGDTGRLDLVVIRRFLTDIPDPDDVDNDDDDHDDRIDDDDDDDYDEEDDEEEADMHLQWALAESAERLRRFVTDPRLDLYPDVSPSGPGPTRSRGARSRRPDHSDRVETRVETTVEPRVAPAIYRGVFVRECLTNIPDYPDDLQPRIEQQLSGSLRIPSGEDLGVGVGKSGASGKSLLPSSRQRGPGANPRPTKRTRG